MNRNSKFIDVFFFGGGGVGGHRYIITLKVIALRSTFRDSLVFLSENEYIFSKGLLILNKNKTHY